MNRRNELTRIDFFEVEHFSSTLFCLFIHKILKPFCFLDFFFCVNLHTCKSELIHSLANISVEIFYIEIFWLFLSSAFFVCLLHSKQYMFSELPESVCE